MSGKRRRTRTRQGLERLTAFSDAVVAIAITLLVLPLTEIAGEIDDDTTSALQILQDHRWQLFTFLLSFVVIARFWVTHHAIFEQVDGYNSRIVWLSFGWMLTIAFLPFPTELTAVLEPDRWTILLYMGDIALCSVLLVAMALVVARNPALQAEGSDWSGETLRPGITITLFLLLALAIALIVPAINYFAYLLLFLADPASRLWLRLRGEGSVNT